MTTSLYSALFTSATLLARLFDLEFLFITMIDIVNIHHTEYLRYNKFFDAYLKTKLVCKSYWLANRSEFELPDSASEWSCDWPPGA